MSSRTFADFLNSLQEFESDAGLAHSGQDQAAIILGECQLNLEQIENGLAAQGWSLDEIVGQTVTLTEADGSQSQLQLSLSGILGAAHMHGAANTLDFLVHGTISTDGAGATIVDYMETFGRFDAPSLADLRTGDLALLVGSESSMPMPGNDNDVGHAGADIVPGYIVRESAPGDPSEIFLRMHDFTADSFTVPGAESLHADNGDDVIFTFGSDSALAFAGGDFHAAGDGEGVLFGSAANDIGQGDGFSAYQASELFALATNDSHDVPRDFQSGIDILDFSAFGEDAIILTEDHGDGVPGLGDIAAMDGISVTELSDDDLRVTLLDDDFGILAN